MDWGRAKTILIGAFLLLNVILGLQLWTTRSVLFDLDAGLVHVAEDMERLMKVKKIRIQTELPSELPKLREIVVRFDDKNTVKQKVALPEWLAYMPSWFGTSFRDATLRSGRIPHFEAYERDVVQSPEGGESYVQLFGRYPMFEARLELTETEPGWIEYSQRYVEEQSWVSQREQRVLSPKTVLRSLMETYFAEGTVVKHVELGYHGQQFNSQTMFMVPSWRIVLGSGEVYYVQALNGAVETPQQAGTIPIR